MRIEPHDYHAVSAAAPDVGGGRQAGAAPDRRSGRAAGARGRAAAAARDRRRAPLGRVVRRAAALPRPQPDHVQVDRRRTQPMRPSSGGARCRPRTTARRSASIGGKTVVRPQLRRVAELLGPRAPSRRAAEYDTVIVGAGPAGLAAAVYGASEGLRTIVVEREAPGGQAGTSSRIENYLGFPSGVSGDELASRALQQARRLGAEILVTRTITRHRRRRRARCTSTAATSCARGRSSSPAASRGGSSSIEGFDRLAGKGVFYGAARSEAREHARPRRPHRRRRQLGGPGGDVLREPRAERDDPLPRRRPREEHVALPDRPARRPAEHRRAVRTEVAAAHGDASIEAIDVRNSATGETTAARLGRRCSSSSAPTPRPAGSRPRSPSTGTATCSPART